MLHADQIRSAALIVSICMSSMLIREAVPDDAEALCGLYSFHLTSRPPEDPQDMVLWREKVERFEQDPYYHLLVGEVDGQVVASITLVVIENLTRGMRPYAIIENVVTHSGYRGRGLARKLVSRAVALAAEHDCYKAMLMAGSASCGALQFYEKCGFNSEDKVAFIKWLDRQI